MRVLVIGGGGREHALVWKIAQSPLVAKIYCAPGNAGIAQLAECVRISADNLTALAEFADANQIDLTVVGPEAPLIAGIVDVFERRGLPIFGPATDPARIEGSKAFAKELMVTAGIPTAAYQTAASPEEAHAQVRAHYGRLGPQAKLVVKADGIAAGKGVVVAQNEAEALAAVDSMMCARVFGASGDRLVLEECLEGPEASLMAITDGETVVPLAPAQDYKRVGEGNTGPNTGGMGAYAPITSAILSPEVTHQAVERILKPAVKAIRELGIPYKGILYAGIMVTSEGPKCIEFNCRLGDPEAQVVLPLLESDLVSLIQHVLDSTLDQVPIQWRQETAACVVATSGGYPESYATGKVIGGLDQAATQPNCLVFHSGTALENGQVVTAGGRVLSVTGLGASLPEAVANAYEGLRKIHFDKIYYRHDIGHCTLNV